jgi:hypothetical protein
VALLLCMMTVTGVGLAVAPATNAASSAPLVPTSGNAGCIVIGTFALCIPFL